MHFIFYTVCKEHSNTVKPHCLHYSIPANHRLKTCRCHSTSSDSLNKICRTSTQKDRIKSTTSVFQKLILSAYACKTPKLVAVFRKAVCTDPALTSQATAKQCLKTKERLLKSAKRDAICCRYDSGFMNRKQRILALGS